MTTDDGTPDAATELTVATLLWQANSKSQSFSRMYDEAWVERLYRGFARNLTRPFRFVCLTDRERTSGEPIEWRVVPGLGKGGYGDCIQAYAIDGPMILCGLDTVVVGNCDALADYCFTDDRQALPRDPYHPEIACNGVALVPAGWTCIATEHRGENDMAWVRQYSHNYIDDVFGNAVKSYKGHVKKRGLDGVSIVYFHGREKPHEMRDAWIREAWK